MVFDEANITNLISSPKDLLTALAPKYEGRRLNVNSEVGEAYIQHCRTLEKSQLELHPISIILPNNDDYQVRQWLEGLKIIDQGEVMDQLSLEIGGVNFDTDTLLVGLLASGHLGHQYEVASRTEWGRHVAIPYLDNSNKTVTELIMSKRQAVLLSGQLERLRLSPNQPSLPTRQTSSRTNVTTLGAIFETQV